MIVSRSQPTSEEKFKCNFSATLFTIIPFIIAVILKFFSSNIFSYEPKPEDLGIMGYSKKLELLYLYFYNAKTFFIIMIVLFNFGNIYQVLILFQFTTFSFIYEIIYSKTIFEGLLTQITPKIFTVTCFFLILYGVLNFFKFLLFLLTIMIVVIYFILTFGSQTNTFYGLLSDVLFGVSFYLFIFRLLNINCNNSTQLANFLQKIKVKDLVIMACILFFLMVIMSFWKLFENKYFDNNTIIQILLLLISTTISILGIRLEYKYTFDDLQLQWKKYNFTIKENEDEDERLEQSMTIVKHHKWNNTSFIKSFIRLILLLILTGGSYYIIEYLKMWLNNDKELKYNQSSYTIFFIVFAVEVFGVDKYLMKFCKLINETFFYLRKSSLSDFESSKEIN